MVLLDRETANLLHVAQTILARLELEAQESNNGQFTCAALLPDLRRAIANFVNVDQIAVK